MLAGWLHHWPGSRHRLGLARCLAKSFRLILDPRLQKCLGEIRGKLLRKTKGDGRIFAKTCNYETNAPTPAPDPFPGPGVASSGCDLLPNLGGSCSKFWLDLLAKTARLAPPKTGPRRQLAVRGARCPRTPTCNGARRGFVSHLSAEACPAHFEKTYSTKTMRLAHQNDVTCSKKRLRLGPQDAIQTMPTPIEFRAP